MTIGTRTITAPRGSVISCKAWPQEAALRMLMLATRAGVKNKFDIPGFVPEYVRPLFCEGEGPFRWAALSGDPKDIHMTNAKSHGITVPMMH